MPRTRFGQYVYSRRKALNPPLTQEDIAKRLTGKGFKHSAPSVAHWESTKREVYPDFHDKEFVRALAEILQTSVFTLRREAGLTEDIDAPLSPNESKFNELFHLLSAERQKLYIAMIESEIRSNSR